MVWCLKNLIYFLVFLFFSSYAFSIEISDDLFIKENDSEEAAGEIVEGDDWGLVEPGIKKVYKKEKVIIKRDLSSLSQAVKKLSEEEAATNVSLGGKLSKRRDLSSEFEEKSSDFEKESSSYVDYGDYEIHWDRKKR